jgi:hypothetical protein
MKASLQDLKGGIAIIMKSRELDRGFGGALVEQQCCVWREIFRWTLVYKFFSVDVVACISNGEEQGWQW